MLSTISREILCCTVTNNTELFNTQGLTQIYEMVIITTISTPTLCYMHSSSTYLLSLILTALSRFIHLSVLSAFYRNTSCLKCFQSISCQNTTSQLKSQLYCDEASLDVNKCMCRQTFLYQVKLIITDFFCTGLMGLFEF